MNTLEERVQRCLREDVRIAPYDAAWPGLFRQEPEHLRAWLPPRLLRRIEHFGSTAVPGLAAKPIIDMLVQATSLALAAWANSCVVCLEHQAGPDVGAQMVCFALRIVECTAIRGQAFLNR